MSKVYVFDHPLIQHKVSMMRDKNTTTKDFRQLAQEVVTLMTFEATRDLPLKEVEIETPICKGKFNMLAGEEPLLSHLDELFHQHQHFLPEHLSHTQYQGEGNPK